MLQINPQDVRELQKLQDVIWDVLLKLGKAKKKNPKFDADGTIYAKLDNAYDMACNIYDNLE